MANVDVWKSEPVRERIAALVVRQREAAQALKAHPNVSSVRTCGTIVAVDMKTASTGYLASAAPKLAAFFLTRGILLRPLGNTIYVLPPYCITDDQLALVYDTIQVALDQAGDFV